MVEKKKFKLWEKIFVGLSALMVLIVVIVYGTRFIHYYMIEHPKAVDNSIAEYIKRNRTVLSGDGLYTVDESNYYFYGKNINNYLWYSGRLWQIVDINPSGIKLITANNETSLVFSKESSYEESYVNKWLTDNYLKTLKMDDLVSGNVCIDSFNLDNVTCNNNYQSYVGLISIQDYLRAGGSDSYLNNSSYFWTSNSLDNREYYVFNTGGINNLVSNDKTYYSYGVRPVIVIKNNYTYYGGDGTIENPYQMISDDDMNIASKNVGDYISFSNYKFRILSKDDNNVRLILDGYINDKTYTYSNAITYLNKDFLNTLDKSKMVKCEFNNGSYGKNTNYDYNNVTKKKMTNYVGVPSISDLFILDYENIWLNNSFEGGKNLQYKINSSKNIMADVNTNKNNVRAVICVKNDISLVDGMGTLESPYQVGE